MTPWTQGAAVGVELLRQSEGLAGRLVSCVATTQVGVGHKEVAALMVSF